VEGTHKKGLVSLVLLAGTTFLILGCKPSLPDSAKSDGAAQQYPVPSAEAGDLVFRYGNGPWSKYFRDLSQQEKRFSHVGVVVVEDEELAVVHASADDRSGVGHVRLESLASFTAEFDNVAVYRVNCSPEQRLEIAEAASSHVGKPFDAWFDLSSGDEVYCSELVRNAVNGVLKEEAVTTTTVNGRVIVTIDNCYLGLRFTKVYDRSGGAGE
jgi:hypothetical protein